MEESKINQQAFVGQLKDVRPLSFVQVKGTEEEQLWNELVRKWHYLGYERTIGSRVKYLVLLQNRPFAAIGYNAASLRIGVRDAFLGWEKEADSNCSRTWSIIIDSSFCRGFRSRIWFLIYCLNRCIISSVTGRGCTA